MQVAVWDTYITKKNGTIVHFDIIVPEQIKDEKIIHHFGTMYLLSKDLGDQPLTSKECKFCHIERASAEIELSIKEKGYYILEKQNCK